MPSSSENFAHDSHYQLLKSAAEKPMDILASEQETPASLEKKIFAACDATLEQYGVTLKQTDQKIWDDNETAKQGILQQFGWPGSSAPEEVRAKWNKENSQIWEQIQHMDAQVAKKRGELYSNLEQVQKEVYRLRDEALTRTRAAFAAKETAQELIVREVSAQIVADVASKRRGALKIPVSPDITAVTNEIHSNPISFVKSSLKEGGHVFSSHEIEDITTGILASMPADQRKDFLRDVGKNPGTGRKVPKTTIQDVYASVVTSFAGEKVPEVKSEKKSDAFDELLSGLQKSPASAQTAPAAPEQNPTLADQAKVFLGEVLNSAVPKPLQGMILQTLMDVPSNQKSAALAKAKVLYSMAQKLPATMPPAISGEKNLQYLAQIFNTLQANAGTNTENIAVLNRYERLKTLLPGEQSTFVALNEAMKTSTFDAQKMSTILDTVEKQYREKSALALLESWKSHDALYAYFTQKSFIEPLVKELLKQPTLEAFEEQRKALESPETLLKNPEMQEAVQAATASAHEKIAVIQQYQKALPERWKKLSAQKRSELPFVTHQYSFLPEKSSPFEIRTALEGMKDLKTDYETALAGLGELKIKPVQTEKKKPVAEKGTEATKETKGKAPRGSGGSSSESGGNTSRGGSEKTSPKKPVETPKEENSDVPKAPDFITQAVQEAVTKTRSTFTKRGELVDPWGATDNLPLINKAVDAAVQKVQDWEKNIPVGKKFRVEVAEGATKATYTVEKQKPKIGATAKPEERLAVKVEKINPDEEAVV